MLTIDVRSDLSASWWGLQDTAVAWTDGLERHNSRKNFHVSVDRLLWAGFGNPPALLQSLD